MQIVTEALPLQTETADNTPAFLKGYLHEPDPEIERDQYPAIVICPGGSFTHIPEHQAETLAMAFYNQGFQAFYLRYHFIDEQTPLFPVPFIDLADAMKAVRRNSDDWHVDAEHVAVSGFSVGGQIAAVYNGSWMREWLLKATQATKEELQPNAVVLGYPVIRLDAGFPKDDTLTKALTPDVEEFAADMLVNADSQPTFVWGTADDTVVPAKNGLVYVEALQEAGIPLEYHLFAHGPHGMALATRQTASKPSEKSAHVAHWFPLCIEWLNQQFDLN
ncbi:esterase lipase [Lactobacillus selangorensis]|uniref:Esterase lipase n=1 Tax=Lactobacillus selangorensis TaxID=81857 RepID=A0A0R2FHX1_9LACO|nr:alpha/beta hydrolase [Lactobacillus selangorensis]KRN28239.1 esterase lipase [Lactobacillus selangorensis]KRN30885.1 esterase lipase [Lactobacillus selangorensis]